MNHQFGTMTSRLQGFSGQRGSGQGVWVITYAISNDSLPGMKLILSDRFRWIDCHVLLKIFVSFFGNFPSGNFSPLYLANRTSYCCFNDFSESVP